MNRHQQQGSAHVIIIVILVIALIGALGWIFWQNFIDKTDGTRESAKVSVKPEAENDENTEEFIDTLTYSDKSLSLEYPSEGWVISEESSYKSLRSTDYKPYIGMGLESGAELIVSVNDVVAGDPLKPTERQAYGYSDAEKVTIAGHEGYTYKLSYEGVRYGVDFDVDGKRYQITLQIAGEELSDKQSELIEMIVETAKL